MRKMRKNVGKFDEKNVGKRVTPQTG